MSIDYSKPNLVKYRKRKKDFSDKNVRKIFGYMEDPKVQNYIKGLDDKGAVSFVDSLMKMQTDKSFTPDIFKPKEEKKIKEDLSKAQKSKLNNALDNFTSTLELNDPEGLKAYAKEIIEIKPELTDSIQNIINKSVTEPEKATKEWFSGKWFSKLKNAWYDNVENTNNMVKSPPPNLQKDPKEESKDKPQIKKTEKVELDDNLVSSKDDDSKSSKDKQKNKDNPKSSWDYNIKNSGFDTLTSFPLSYNPDYTDKNGNTGQISQSYIGAYKIHKTSDGQYALFDPLTDDSQLEWDGYGFKRTPKLFKTKRQAEKYVKKAYKNFLKNK